MTASTRGASDFERLRQLHRPGHPLVLVNAWDVASAQYVEHAGACAVGTSSAAIAASLGVPDDRGAPIDAMFDAVARIAGSVAVPVTADVLDGYGLDPGELVDRLVSAGAVGCNLEDSDHTGDGANGMVDASVAGRRLEAVRAAASALGVDLVLNARIDCFLHDRPWKEMVERARVYLSAGADCVFPVRLAEPELVRTLFDEIGAPINAGVAPDGSIADLAAAGASRVSMGPMAQRVALAALDELATRLLRDP